MTGLDRRPTATTYDLEELVRRAWEGFIRVPAFQRPFRWTSQDVLRLFDSILKGYPIGSLLLWVKQAEREPITLGALQIEAPQTDHAMWVVDGQQRITSLANALHPTGHLDARFALDYDLKSRRFVPHRHSPDSSLVPLPVIFDLQRLIRWFADNPEVSQYLDEATSVAKTILQYKVPAYEVDKGDEVVLRDIFDRMNSYGRRLKRAEIFSALHRNESSDPSANVLDIAAIGDRLDVNLGFGRVDDDTIVRAILARRGPDIARDIRAEFSITDRRVPLDFQHEDRDTAYVATEDALRAAIGFLQRIAGVPHFTMLPYRYLLVVLCRLFAHHPELSERDAHLLRRWYWRAAVLGPEIFKGSATGAMRALCARIDANSLTHSIESLLDAVQRDAPPLPSVKRFRANEAATKIIICSWWSLSPRSLQTGKPFTEVDLTNALADRSTASDIARYIISLDSTPSGDIRLSAGNRLLMPVEDEAVDEVDSLLLNARSNHTISEAEIVLRSHLIEGEALEMLNRGQVEMFIRSRESEVRAQLGRFLDRACEWTFEDTPALDRFLVLDDSGDP